MTSDDETADTPARPAPADAARRLAVALGTAAPEDDEPTPAGPVPV